MADYQGVGIGEVFRVAGIDHIEMQVPEPGGHVPSCAGNAAAVEHPDLDGCGIERYLFRGGPGRCSEIERAGSVLENSRTGEYHKRGDTEDQAESGEQAAASCRRALSRGFLGRSLALAELAQDFQELPAGFL